VDLELDLLDLLEVDLLCCLIRTEDCQEGVIPCEEVGVGILNRGLLELENFIPVTGSFVHEPLVEKEAARGMVSNFQMQKVGKMVQAFSQKDILVGFFEE
jgi:hypothetical protein